MENVYNVQRLHNDSKLLNTINCRYKTSCEEKVRKAIVDGMALANSPGGISFGEVPSLDSKFWVLKDYRTWTWNVNPDKKPSEAIERIFETGAKSEMECESVISAIYYRAILKTCGADKFDQMFPKGKGLTISQKRNSFNKYVKNKPKSAPLESGDWVYVRGFPDYDSEKMNSVLGRHGHGDCRGENAIVMEDGSLAGLPIRSDEKSISDTLLRAYDQKVDDYNKKVDEINSSPTRPGPKMSHMHHGNSRHMPGIDRNNVLSPNAEEICKCGDRSSKPSR